MSTTSRTRSLGDKGYRAAAWTVVLAACTAAGAMAQSPPAATGTGPSTPPGPVASVLPGTSPAPIGPDGLGPAPAPPIGAPWTIAFASPVSQVDASIIVQCGGGFTFMAGGGDGPRHNRARFWTSPDGHAWSRAGTLRPDPGPPTYWLVTELVAFRGSLLALGGDGRHLAVWRSGNCGRSWHRLHGPAFALGSHAYGISHGVEAAVTGDRMLVIARQGGEEIPPRQWAWTVDGDGHWRRIPRGLYHALDGGLGSTGTSFFATRWVPGKGGDFLVTSPDGRTWTTLGLLPSETDVTWDPDGHRFLAISGEQHAGGTASPQLWQSPDGVTWSLLATGSPTDEAFGSRVAAGRGQLIWALDTGFPDVDKDPWSWIATSTDGGLTWSVSAGWQGLALDGARSIVIGPQSTLIAGGGWYHGPRIWTNR